MDFQYQPVKAGIVRVFQMVELVEDPKEDNRFTKIESFILAKDIPEACKINGDQKGRRVIAIQDIGPVAQFPDDSFRICEVCPPNET